MISYGGNHYSVPAAYARQTLQVRETEDRQLIVVNAVDQEIARHRLLEGHHQRAMVAAHYESLDPRTHPPQHPVAAQGAAPQVESRPLSWYEQVAEAAG